MKRATIVFDKERSKNENFDAKQTKSKTNFPVAFGIVNMALLLLPKTGYFMKLIYLFLLFICTACSSDSNKGFDNFEEIKKDFITNILTESTLDEGPFQMNYHLRAILFSDNVVSLMGEVFVYDHLPHGWTQYEGKTYVKIYRT